MKKISVLMALILALLALAGCGAAGNSGSSMSNSGSSSAPAVTLEGTPSEIIDKIYAGAPEDLEYPMMLATSEITEDNSTYMVGVERSEYKEGAVSESMVGSIAYSMAVLRANDAAGAQVLADSVKEKVDPRKWICVEAETVNTAVIGDVVFMVMADQATADALTASFEALAQA